MRKRVIGSPDRSGSDPSWLDLEGIAEVEITSEDRAHPVESAMRPGAGSGWRAAHDGEQRMACSARCRAAWSRLRRAQTQERRDREIRALFEEALRHLGEDAP